MSRTYGPLSSPWFFALLGLATTLVGLGGACSSTPSSGGADGGTTDGGEDGGATEDGDVPVKTYTLSGTVKGLEGSNLVLRVNTETFPVTTNGNFTASAELTAGTAYTITVETQPTSPSQTCTVTGGTGVLGAEDVKGIVVDCTTNTYPVGGTVSGLEGTGFVLKNSGGDSLPITKNGAFTFPTKVASGKPYDVTVGTGPVTPTQTCVVDEGSGTIGEGAVTNVVVTCTTNLYSVGGTITGLKGEGFVLANGADEVRPSMDGPFTFGNDVKSGSTYAVTIRTQPTSPTQVCTLASATGTVGGANVTNVGVTCVTTKFHVGGTVSGLIGGTVNLSLNGGTALPVSVNGAFQFPTTIESGSMYSVTVTPPAPPSQACTVDNDNGTVGDGDVANVVVTCRIPD
ncbi:MAG: hypothetical protein U0169_05095 [Polyangiaceae bacterium]